MTDLENDFPSWGETGEYPANGFFYEGGDQVNEKHFDALWHGIDTHLTELIDGITARVEDTHGNVVLDGGMEVSTDGSSINVTASSAGAYVNGQKTGATSAFSTTPSQPTSSVRRDAVWVDNSGQIGVTEGTTTVSPNRYKIAEYRINNSAEITLVLNTARHVARTFSGDAYAAGDDDGGSGYSPSSFGGGIREGDLFYNDDLSKTRVQTNGDFRSVADERDTVGISAGKGITSGNPASVVGSETVDVAVNASDIAGSNLVVDGDGNLAVSNEITTSIASADQIQTSQLSVNTGSGGWVLNEEDGNSSLDAVDNNGSETDTGLTYTTDDDRLDVSATAFSVDVSSHLDFGGSQVHGLRPENVSSDPSGPSAGQIWYREDGNALKLQTSNGTTTVQTNNTDVPEDVTDSRTDGTWYQNTSGRPLRVSVMTQGDYVAHTRLHVNDSETDNIADEQKSAGSVSTDSNEEGQNATSTAIVPDGCYYKAFTYYKDGGTFTDTGSRVDRWTEQGL